MRIQHNITALNAYRNLTNNNSAVGKNLEKLSSGYRINRAGDDAAGLAISEKMRAQITGLETAQKNANDGISLVQTAEGAMTEVHDMLNRMVELADQSANGTYADEVDRENLQKELVSLQDEINRIADSTNFNGINLLDGSMSSKGIAASKGSFSDLPEVGDVLGTNTVLHKEAGTAASTTFSVDLHNLEFVNGAAGDTLKIKIGSDEFTYTASAAGTIAAGTKMTASDIATAFANGEFKNADDTAMTAAKATVGKAQFKVEANGTRITFTQDDADKTAVNPDMKVSVSGDAISGATTPTITGPTAKTITKATVAADVTGAKAKFTIDLKGLTTAKATTLTFTIGGKTYEVTTADGDDDKTIAGKLVEKLNEGDGVSDDNAGKYTITDKNDGTITLEGEVEAAAKTDLSTGFKVEAKAVEDAINLINSTTGTVNDANGTDGPTAVFDLAGLVAPEAGKLTFTINGSDYTVDVTKDESASDIATALAGKMTGLTDATAGALTVTASDTKITITGATNTTGTKFTGTYDSYTVKNGNYDTTKGSVNKDEGGATAAKAGDTFSFDLAGMTSEAGDVEFKIGENTYTVTVADGDDDAAIAGKLVTAMNANKLSDETVGTWTATATGTSIKLTSEKGGTAKTDLTGTFTVTGKAAGGTKESSITGDYNVSTTDIQRKGDTIGKRLASTYFTLTSDLVGNGNSITIGKTTYTFSTDAADSGVTAPARGTAEGTVYIGDLDSSASDYMTQVAERLTDMAANNGTYTVGHDGSRITVTEVDGQTEFVEDNKSSLTSLDKIKESLGYTKAGKAGKGSLTLQIGDTSDSFNQLKVTINDIHIDAMGIGDISIDTQANAAKAVDKIKAAINYVSSTRGDLGAIQNRLEHTINNLSVTTENITAAESRIRDVDMAEEMMAYTKNNILVQASQAMLAQANQIPQGVLQLLQ